MTDATPDTARAPAPETARAGLRGIILYGPPASGKNTITAALTELDPRIRLFRRLKVGSGNTAPYRMITREELDQLRAASDIVWENNRYGYTYAVDRSGLAASLAEGIPVVHVGQPKAIAAIRGTFMHVRWHSVELRCPQSEAIARLRGRSHEDTPGRLRAWNETPPGECATQINTGATPPTMAAKIVWSLITS